MVEESKPNFFIDTNVLIDYILLNDILKEEDREHFPLYDKLKPGLDLLNLFFQNKDKIRWCTSFFNLCEMPSVLIKHIVLDRMYIKRIPFDYFEKYYSNFIKQKNFQKELSEILIKYAHFMKKLWFIHTITISGLGDFSKIDRLRLIFRLPLNDAFIFFTAKKEGGYFVTNDKHHFNNPKLKKEYENQIKIISPIQAIKEAKKIISSAPSKSKPYMEKKEQGFLDSLKYFNERKSIIESNLKRDEKELEKRKRLGKERGIKEPLVIPEGYVDRDKQLKEGIEISKKQLKECEKVIKNIQVLHGNEKLLK